MSIFRRLLAALLLVPTLAWGAIAEVDDNECSDVTTSGGNAKCTVTKPTGAVDGNLLVFFVMTANTNNEGAPAITPPSGLTAIANEAYTTGADIRLAVYIKEANTEPASYTFTGTQAGTGTNYVAVQAIAFSGADTSALDVTYSSGSHLVTAANTINPDAPDITTATDNAWVLTALAATHNEITAFGAPSGLALLTPSAPMATYRNLSVAYVLQASAGAVSPGVWTNTGTAVAAESVGITIAVKPAAGGCPAVCASGTAVCITNTSGNTDPDNILYGQSPAIVANQDTICYEATTDILSDTATVSAAGWVSFASGGDNRTDDIDYTIMDNGAAAGAAGTFQMTETPVLSAPAGVGTGETTATLTATTSQAEGRLDAVVVSKTSYDTYGAPSIAEVATGKDGNGATASAWTWDAMSARTNLIAYSKLSGAVAGTPGTAPTGWVFGTYAGTTATAVSALHPESYTFTATASAARHYIYYPSGTALTAAANTTYVMSFDVEAVSGGLKYNEVFSFNGTVGSVGSYYLNGALKASGDAVGVGRVTITLTVAGTPGTITPRLGVGVSSGQTPTGSITFSAPQLEAASYASSYIPTTTATVTDTASTSFDMDVGGLTAGTTYRSCFTQANEATTPLTASVVCSDEWSTIASGDTTPDAFAFIDLVGAEPGETHCSYPVRVAGIDAPANVTVVGGTYTIDDSDEYSDEQQVEVDQEVRACVVASSEFSDSVSATVTIGGVSDTFTVTNRDYWLTGFVKSMVQSLITPLREETVQ